jgi:pyruvate formate lyase activating enzyme
MCDAIEHHGVSKRDFLKLCLVGFGGCMVGAGGMSALARTSAMPLGAASGKDLWKWSKEAPYWVKTARGYQCKKCPNECELAPGDTGLCRNRVNHEGKLYSIAYGNPCAVHVDPIEKKPLYHFLPTTKAFSIAAAGCNFRCLNCQNWEISQSSPYDTVNDDLMPAAVVEQCIRTKCESIAYTYSEPTTFFEYAYDTAKIARGKGIKNVWKSNGYIQETPLRDLCKVIDAANIDLKCFDESIYARLSSGSLAPILRTLKVLKQEGVWLEITCLIVPEWTDDLGMIKRMCEWLVANGLGDCPVHFTRFMPLYKLTQLPITPVSTLESAREIALKAGVHYPYVGNVPGHPAENTYCHSCGRMIMERRGFAILENHIVAGKCEFCKAKIPGVWG